MGPWTGTSRDVKGSFNIQSFGFPRGTRLEFHKLDAVRRVTARSYDLARPGVATPLVGSLSAVLFHLYSAADTSIACATDY